ncbi:ADP,ATP carrier protein 1 [Blattella germanica]|nr:ADP,ATP carrier protein 1 [Blattella germanica]
MLDAFIRIPKEQGFFSLWRGNLVNVIRYFPTMALNFSFKEKLKELLVGDTNKHTHYGHYFLGSLLAGALAGAASLTFVYPLDYVRTRLAADIGKLPTDREYTGPVDCLKRTLKTDGIHGLYRGFIISLQGIMIYRACYFGFFDFCKDMTPIGKKKSFIVSFFQAQVVVMSAETIAYPMDTVRRRMMMQSNRSVEKVVYKNSMDCIVKIYKQEGANAFFKGNVTNLARSTGSALVLVFYDIFIDLLNKDNT